ncbi:hypothetical protein DFP85_107161 [Halomonas ventosae]|uniref:Zinc resistance-associated protein n=1 Tax=Halomonas ventosae TaxID=229007 RepID=A0A4R6ZPJ9_9GAMM|nr:hypothetical protein [Halomonas ventosae]TDR54388.1 hypothetical protein DFP85_107161 [Halomonas ventosae]
MASISLITRGLRLLPVAALCLFIGLAQAQSVADEERLYGGPMLNQQERDQFQQQMREARTLEERQRIQAEHQSLMRQRAEQRGFDPDGIYGYPMMNQQQRREYHQRMQGAGSDAERQRIRQQHREQMRQQILQQQRSPRGQGGGGQGGQGGGGHGGGQGSGRMMNQGGGGGRG